MTKPIIALLSIHSNVSSISTKLFFKGNGILKDHVSVKFFLFTIKDIYDIFKIVGRIS